MLDIEIYDKLKKYPHFAGVFARDQLPASITLPMGLIANTDPLGMPGKHWVAIYIDEDGFGEYFDSFGFPPLYREFEDFLLKFCPNGFVHNRNILQCLTCITCGQYSTAYLIARFNYINYSEYLTKFTNNSHFNDVLINYYFNNL